VSSGKSGFNSRKLTAEFTAMSSRGLALHHHLEGCICCKTRAGNAERFEYCRR